MGAEPTKKPTDEMCRPQHIIWIVKSTVLSLQIKKPTDEIHGCIGHMDITQILKSTGVEPMDKETHRRNVLASLHHADPEIHRC